MANRLQVLNTCQSCTKKDPDMSKFNAISYEQELEAAGVAKEQAAVHARALGEVMTEVAFCSDLKAVEHNVRQEIVKSEQRLSERIEVVRETLDTKIDATKIELSAKIENVKTELNAKIENVKTELNAKIENVKFELNAKIDSVKTELNAKIDLIKLELGILGGRMSAVEHELKIHRWMFGFVITLQAGTLAGVIKLLSH